MENGVVNGEATEPNSPIASTNGPIQNGDVATTGSNEAIGAGAESEEYESANEGDTEGETAAVVKQEAEAAASTGPSHSNGSSTLASAQTSPATGDPNKNIEQQLSQLTVKENQSAAQGDILSVGLSDHAPEDVESKEAEESSTDNEPALAASAGSTLSAAEASTTEAPSTDQLDTSAVSSTALQIPSSAKASKKHMKPDSRVGTEEESSKTEDSANPHSSLEEQGGNDEDDAWVTDEDEEEEEDDEGEEEGQDNEAPDIEAGEGKPEDVKDSETGKLDELSVDVQDENDQDLLHVVNDKSHPAYTPRQGRFFMHDNRSNEFEDESKGSPRNQPREWQPNVEPKRWQHDMFSQPQNVPFGSMSSKVQKSNEIATGPKGAPINRRRNPNQPQRPTKPRNIPQADALPGDARFLQDRDGKRRPNRTFPVNKGGKTQPPRNVSTTEDENFASNNDRQYPRKPAAFGAQSSSTGVYINSKRPQQPSAYPKSASRKYHESDDSGYMIDDFESSGYRYNNRYPATNRYPNSRVVESAMIDDGSRHGAFLSARRAQVYRPDKYFDSKMRRDQRRVSDDRNATGAYSTRPQKNDTPPQTYEYSQEDYKNRSLPRRKPHSRERDSVGSYERYNPQLERSKSLKTTREDPDAKRNFRKAEISPKSKTSEFHFQRGHKLSVERTDSSDLDHDGRGGKRKDVFETPPRFEKLNLMGTSNKITSGSKKVGVTRPFIQESPKDSPNIDSDQQIGYIASEEQDASDSAVSGFNPVSLNDPSTLSMRNKRYSAGRRNSLERPGPGDPSGPPHSMGGVLPGSGPGPGQQGMADNMLPTSAPYNMGMSSSASMQQQQAAAMAAALQLQQNQPHMMPPGGGPGAGSMPFPPPLSHGGHSQAMGPGPGPSQQQQPMPISPNQSQSAAAAAYSNYYNNPALAAAALLSGQGMMPPPGGGNAASGPPMPPNNPPSSHSNFSSQAAAAAMYYYGPAMAAAAAQYMQYPSGGAAPPAPPTGTSPSASMGGHGPGPGFLPPLGDLTPQQQMELMAAAAAAGFSNPLQNSGNPPPG